MDLSPSERSNFNTYFVRSLSHKFYNCSCYSLSSEKVHKSWHDPRQARSSSPVSCSLSPSPEDSKIWENKRRWRQTSRRNSQHFCESPCKCATICIKRFQRQLRKNNLGSKRRPEVTNKRRLEGEETDCKPRSMSCPDVGVQFYSASTSCFLYTSCSLDSLHPLCLICSHAIHKAHSSLDLELELDYQPGYICAAQSNKVLYHNCHYLKCHRSKSPKNPIPKLQQQRSFSSPDTRPSIIQPDPTCTARRHRHSISGQMSYFKLLGYNVSKKLTGSANSLFSTAVISGSSSAPNLKDMVPAHASAVAGKLDLFLQRRVRCSIFFNYSIMIS